ncbi:hypothetical protein ECG_09229 [Echinococcus granulosus]|uniref:Uncharacterized protein n=1 Tax=Echinococcus granulosus TaxID=6210 RepID=W6U3X1_ECHGR|nr:hypothetical protein EGR_09856 [Echinococcus granulosus]EUB55291.1 hypothetical protein EGR_09856 [Echinococcus granulosus]KAH9278281.1 hypothetical protein ECG_09229 [Echinococcus granulosus]
MSGSPTETPLSAKVTLLSSSSFRADDILRSKLSTQENTVPPVFHSLPPKFPSDKEPPITMSPSLPQIRPPAFSPLVNIKHITPFEHNKKPLFRARQASEPPPTLDVKAARSPSPPSPVLSPSRQKPVPKAQSASSVVYNPLSSYSWDSWAKPVFVRGPGFLDTPAENGSVLENKQSQPQDPYPPAPPPILYYDPFLGQYVATPGYHTVGRYSQTLGRRQPSRRQHQQHRSVGHYSTCRTNRSTSCLSTYAPDSMSGRQYPLDEHLIGNVVPYQQAQAPIPRSATPQRTVPLRPNYRNESEMRLDKKTYLVSSGTDDIPIQLVDTLSPRKQSYNFNNIRSDNADPLESISQVYIPPTMVVSRPSTIPVKSSDDPIRYTSDVVRSLNRQTFKMGQRQSKEGALSPRDHYLEVVNGPSHPRVSEKYVFPNSSLNGGERRPGVMDLVKKYSQYEEAAYEPQMRNPRRVMDSRNNVEDFAAISSNMSYNEAMARKPYIR